MCSFVAVDLGASCTRCVSNPGKISILPNNMVFLDLDAEVNIKPHGEDIQNSLEIVISKEGEESKFFPVRALIGELADRYSGTNERPSMMRNKHVQKINYVSGILSVALSKLAYNLKGDIRLYVGLPPIECKSAKDELERNLKGKYTVEFPKHGRGITTEFFIGDVMCLEESFMAMVSYFFDSSGVTRPSASKYRTGNILSLDIGSSTTDIAIVKDGVYLDKSGQTYKTGGSMARDYIVNEVRVRYGFDLPIEDARTTLAEGRLQLGNTYEIITDIIEDAKRSFAEAVVQQMQGYFRQVNIPIQAIRAIIVSGGGSMCSQFVDENGETILTSKPMSYYITEYLTDICEGVEVEQHGEDSRLANIRGMYIKAMADSIKKINSKKVDKDQEGTIESKSVEDKDNMNITVVESEEAEVEEVIVGQKSEDEKS